MSTDARARFIERLFALPVTRPWTLLLAGVLLLGALAPGLGRLHMDVRQRSWFPPGHPAVERLDSFETRFGSDIPAILAIHSPSGIFDRESAELLREVTARMWHVTDMMRVESLSNFKWIRARGDEIIVNPLLSEEKELTEEFLAQRRQIALEHETLPGYLISPDGTTTVIYGWPAPEIDKSEEVDYAGILRDLREIVKDFDSKGDHSLYISGMPVFEASTREASNQAGEQMMPLMLLSCIVLLFVFFRRVSGFVLPLFAVVIPAVLASLGFIGWLGSPINELTSIGPQVIVAIGISSSVHVLFVYFRALAGGMPRPEAVGLALKKTLKPTLFACATTAVGFLSFVTNPVQPLRQFGILITAGVVAVWLLIWLVLAPLLVVLPIKPRRQKDAGRSEAEDVERAPPFMKRYTAWLSRYRKHVIVGWVAVTVGSLVLGSQVPMVMVPKEYFSKGTEVRDASDFLEDKMGGADTLEIVIDSGEDEGIKDPEFLHRVEKLGAWVESRPYGVRAVSLVEILKETNRALHGGAQEHYRIPESRSAVAEQYMLYTLNLPAGQDLNNRVALSSDALRMTVMSPTGPSDTVLQAIDEIEAKAVELGLNAEVTGRSALLHHLNPYVTATMARSLAVVWIVVGVFLVILLRSVGFGLLSLIPNLVPIAIGAGIFYFLGATFELGAMMAFSVAVGLAVDDTIHSLTGYKMLRERGFDRRESIARLGASVFPAMVITTAVLAAAFSIMMLADFTPIRIFGLMVGSMLVVALLADTMFLPALLMSGRKRSPATGTPRDEVGTRRSTRT